MDQVSLNSETIAALQELKGGYVLEVKRLGQQMKGVETKIAALNAKIEAADDAIAAATKIAAKPKEAP